MLGLVLSLASVALAQDVVVNVDPNVADKLGIDGTAAESNLSGAIDENLNINSQQDFLEAMANAAAMSSKGMGVDYASNIKRFMFGVSFGSAVNSAGFQFGRGGRELPEGGFALQMAVMGGINLGMGRDKGFLSRTKLYANGLTLNTSGDFYDASLYNIGAHLQFQLIRPRRSAVVEWGGLAVTSGYDLSTYRLGLSQDMPVGTDVDGTAMTWMATGTYDVSANTTSIPVELSTNLRVAVVTVFAGAGVDLNAGDATSSISLSGPLQASVANQSSDIGVASVTLADTALADDLVPRVFAGVQTGVGPMQVYGQLNVGFNDSVGGHFGGRLSF